jgi:hypothetical protein
MGARTLTAPGAAAVALWVDAWAGGAAAADDLLTVLAAAAPDTPLVLAGADGAVPLASLLRGIRDADVTVAWPLLPRAGRAVGWPRDVPGPPSPAVLLVGGGGPLLARALLQVGPQGWQLTPTHVGVEALLAEALSPRAGARRFTELLDAAARDLARLGLERAAPRAATPRWGRALMDLPPTTDPALAALLHRIAAVVDALELALADEGAAVTAGEARARAASLHRLHGDLAGLVGAVAVGATMVA